MRAFSLSSLLFLTLAACGAESTDKDTAAAIDTGDSADTTDTGFDDAVLAADLWASIADYDTWSLPAGWTDTPVLSGNHMGAYVVTYLNDTLAGWDESGAAPAGSIAVKENFGDEAGTSLMNLTVMQKVTGYDADHADWFWAQYNPDGSVAMAGKVDMCSGCHASAAHDYVYTDPPTGM